MSTSELLTISLQKFLYAQLVQSKIILRAPENIRQFFTSQISTRSANVLFAFWNWIFSLDSILICGHTRNEFKTDQKFIQQGIIKIGGSIIRVVLKNYNPGCNMFALNTVIIDKVYIDSQVI